MLRPRGMVIDPTKRNGRWRRTDWDCWMTHSRKSDRNCRRGAVSRRALRLLARPLLAAVACATAGSFALGAAPTTGPGVLFSPFYYRNDDAPHPRHSQFSGEGTTVLPGDTRERTNSGGWEGLLGPLTWTNPGTSPLHHGLAAEDHSSDGGNGNVTGNQYRFAIEDHGQAPIGTFQRVQNEELLPTPYDQGAGVVPIPSETGAPEVLPTPDDIGGGTLSEAESLGDEPDAPRLQFLRTQTVLLEPGELQVDVGFIYSLAENDLPAVVNIMGTDTVFDANLKQRQLFMPLEFRFGVTPRMQMFLSMPIGWANSEFTIPGVLEDDDNDGGLGDMSLGASFLLFDGGGSDTDVVFTFATTIPSGDSPFLLGSNGFNSPSLGDNFWAISGDLLWINNYDPIVIFYGVGFRHQFERTIAGTLVDPGDEYRLQLGVGFAVNKNVTLSTRFSASFVQRTEFDDVSLDGSFTEPMSMRFAATVARSCYIVEPFAEIGTTDDATSTSFGVVWTY